MCPGVLILPLLHVYHGRIGEGAHGQDSILLLRRHSCALAIGVECFYLLVLRREDVPQIVQQGSHEGRMAECARQTQAFL